MNVVKLSTLKEGEKVTFKSGLIAFFSHFNEKDNPVFLVRHNGYTGHYLLSHLTSDSPLSELE